MEITEGFFCFTIVSLVYQVRQTNWVSAKQIGKKRRQVLWTSINNDNYLTNSSSSFKSLWLTGNYKAGNEQSVVIVVVVALFYFVFFICHIYQPHIMTNKRERKKMIFFCVVVENRDLFDQESLENKSKIKWNNVVVVMMIMMMVKCHF